MQLLGISANNPFSQKAFAESLKLPFPLLSDFPKLEVIRSYGGLSEELPLTVAQRWLFLVGLDGTVRGRWKGNTRDVVPTEMILQTVEEMASR